MSAPLLSLVREEASHWYMPDGTPCHQVPTKDGTRLTATTIRHARKMGLLPSATNVLRQSDKPALTAYKINQAVLAVETSPRRAGESVHAFLHRVLNEDQEQNEERNAAAALGTAIHAGIAEVLAGSVASVDPKMQPAIEAAVSWLQAQQIKPLLVERQLVYKGVCGTADLVGELHDGTLCVVDWKTKSSDLPKEPYDDHREQVAFYTRAALHKTGKEQARAWVAYLSVSEPGLIKPLEIDDLGQAYSSFEALYNHWCYRHRYWPQEHGKN